MNRGFWEMKSYSVFQKQSLRLQKHSKIKNECFYTLLEYPTQCFNSFTTVHLQLLSVFLMQDSDNSAFFFPVVQFSFFCVVSTAVISSVIIIKSNQINFIYIAQNHDHIASMGFTICTATTSSVLRPSIQVRVTLMGGKKGGKKTF